MNAATVKKLIVKDLDLLKKVIAAYTGGGILGLAIFAYPHVYAFYVGALILLTLLISIGCHTIITTVVMEKKEQILPFIITLPVSPLEFYIAKLLANLLIILVPWAIFVGAVSVLIFTSHIPNGLFPFIFLICCFLLVNYAVVLCVAMLTESEGWSIFAMVITNLFLNPFIMWLSQNPEINQNFKSMEMVWNNLATIVLVILVSFSTSLIVFTLTRLSGKRCFI